MSDVTIALPDGRWLRLSREAFDAALAAGADLVAPTSAPAAAVDELLSAEQLEARTAVPASWWQQAAREGRVPHARIGKYVRFRLADVTAHFVRPTDSDSLAAARRWRKSGT